MKRPKFGIKKMKDRLILSILLVASWVILFVFQIYVPIQSAIYVLLLLMISYASLIQAAEYHQRRKIKKQIKKGTYKGKFPEDISYEPFVSVVIPCHNEESVIKDTLDNILALDYKNFELLVVDDRSDDATPQILKQLHNQNPKINYYIRAENSFPGKSAVMNEILPMTQGEVICVFDADARIEPDFLKKIVPYLADPEVGAVQAKKVINNRNFNFLTRCQDNEYLLDAHYQSSRDTIKGAVELRGNGQLVKREAIMDVCGWNNNTITDDLDLSTRLHLSGWDIRFAEDVNVYEEGVLAFFPLLRQRRRWIEGSIRRYLDYSVEILTSKKASLRVIIDMLAFVSEFVLPVWILSEYLIQGFRYAKGMEESIIYTLFLPPVVGLFFTAGLIISIRKYKRYSFLKTIKQSLETAAYMVIIWLPMVSYIVCKIIMSERTMDWGKTAHGVELGIPQENTHQLN